MAKFAHHKYTWTMLHGNRRAKWEFVGPQGGLEFWIGLNVQFLARRVWANLEFHYDRTLAPGDEAPHALACPLTGGACWHSALGEDEAYALWLRIEDDANNSRHETIFRVLEEEYEKRFFINRPVMD